jgi:hypothetical protein
MKASAAVMFIFAMLCFAPASPSHAAQKKVQKLSQPIRSLLFEIDARGITRDNARARNASTLSSPRVRVDEDGRVHVYIHLASYAQAALATLRGKEVDIEIADEVFAIVQGWAPFDRLEEIAALSFVRRVTPPSYGFPQTGSVETEGDGIVRADELRRLGVDGSGVRIGVISDGANNRAAARLSGDLPTNIATYGTCTPRPFDGANCDSGRTCNEGTAMLEIIHDIAPGAQLAMASVNTSLDFVQRVNNLVNAFRADVIVDDLGFFGESYFADDLIARAVAAVADTTVFISSAGNQGDAHYEADYRSTLFQGVDDVHNFGRAAGGAKDPTMNVSIEPGEYLFAVLQWNDPFGGSANDYDLLLFDPGEEDILCPECFSVFEQLGLEDPLEGLCYFNNTGNVVSGKLVVEKFSGSDRRIEMFLLGGGSPIDEYATPAGGVFGHPGLPNVLAVGAIDAADPGNDDIEPFSSHGPARIDFPDLQIRSKPDLAGIDGVSVTGSGGFPSVFFGTSAAAPHVAGVAALLVQVAPEASAAEIREVLVSSAVDLGPSGPDEIFGAGRVDARSAFNRLTNLPAVIQIINTILLGED